MTFNQQAWDTWFNGLDEQTKTLINERFQGLENSVKATRRERDEATGKLSVTAKKANFFEQAHSNNCQNPKVAFALATTDNLFADDGTPKWDEIKSAYPEGFKSTSTNANTKAGAGTTTTPTPSGNARANQAIREALGRSNK